MAHYAVLNEYNIVTGVYVGKSENEVVLDSDGNPINWEIYYGAKRTSYNTFGGIHYQQNGEPNPDQSKAFRKNYAGIGDTYDEERDAFIPPKPYPSWILDEFSCQWIAPIDTPLPNRKWSWNEDILEWVEVD
jgi:hypothetical protein